MDPDRPETALVEAGGSGIEGERKTVRILARCGFTIILSIGVSFFLCFVFGLVAIAVGNFTSESPVSVPALCRIVSSRVDIKSSKVCELGLLNYKAKYVFYPLTKGNKGFRCHNDYYWASVFEVEYKEYFSGRVLHAVAEAPKEALPHECRPSFDTAWLTKLKFKVNETYNCKYTLGSGKADIYYDNLFNCEVKDPSLAEMARRFFILFKRSSIFNSNENSEFHVSYIVAGTLSSMLCGMCSIILLQSSQSLVLTLWRRWEVRKKLQIRLFSTRFIRLCILIAYFSIGGWLIGEYVKLIGLKQLPIFMSNLLSRGICNARS